VSEWLAEEAPDLVCLTEGETGLMPPGGGTIFPEPCHDYGLRRPGHRKVLLWSRSAWRDVDIVGDPGLPGGRFVAGTTETPVGAVRVVGVCVPWHMAHVSGGARDRRLLPPRSPRPCPG
jgi:hypothetical protein